MRYCSLYRMTHTLSNRGRQKSTAPCCASKQRITATRGSAGCRWCLTAWLLALCLVPESTAMSRHRNIGGWVAEAEEDLDDEDYYDDYQEDDGRPLELYSLVTAR